MDDDWAPLILKDDYLFSAVACASGLASDLSPISSGYRTADDNSDNNTTTNNDTNIDAHDDGHALSFMLSPSNNTNCGALQTNGINTIPPMHQNLSEFPFHFTPIDDHSNTQRDTITTSTNATEDHFNPANQQNFITTNHSHHHAHLHTAHHNHVGLIKAEPREEQCLSEYRPCYSISPCSSSYSSPEQDNNEATSMEISYVAPYIRQATSGLDQAGNPIPHMSYGCSARSKSHSNGLPPVTHFSHTPSEHCFTEGLSEGSARGEKLVRDRNGTLWTCDHGLSFEILTDRDELDKEDKGMSSPSPPSSDRSVSPYESFSLVHVPSSTRSHSTFRSRSKMHEMAVRQKLITDQDPRGNGYVQLSNEEKKTLLQEGYTIPTRLPLTKAEEEALKIVRRKIKNKLSAQESRRKRKEYMDNLEQKVQGYYHENTSLKSKLRQLEQANRSLTMQLRKLQNSINPVAAVHDGTQQSNRPPHTIVH